jgi:hypothetical protein
MAMRPSLRLIRDRDHGEVGAWMEDRFFGCHADGCYEFGFLPVAARQRCGVGAALQPL